MPPLLLFTALVWALLLFGGLVIGKPVPDGSGRMPAWMRVASSATLAAAGWLWLAAAGGPDIVLALIAVGMSTHFISTPGDVRVNPQPGSDEESVDG